MLRRMFVIFCLPLFLSCTQQPIASLTANFLPPGDVTGGTSAQANVNFTDFNQPPGPSGNDDKLRMTFTNPEGDTMAIVLSPVGGGFPVQAYYFDGASNTFDLSVTVTFSSGPQTLSTSSTSAGYINLTGVTLENGLVKGVTASFHVNFTDGGAGQGNINFSK